MKREYQRWYSQRLGLELGVVVYGHWGPPLLGFPTSAGDEWELESQSMTGALGGKTRSGGPQWPETTRIAFGRSGRLATRPRR